MLIAQCSAFELVHTHNPLKMAEALMHYEAALRAPAAAASLTSVVRLSDSVSSGTLCLHTAAMGLELQRLMKQREWAWLVAAKILLHWVIVWGAATRARTACTLFFEVLHCNMHLLDSPDRIHKNHLQQANRTMQTHDAPSTFS